MSKYVIDPDNRFSRVGGTYLLGGMMLRVTKDGTPIEGLCDFVPGKLGYELYIWAKEGDQATLVNVGDEVEVVSEQRNEQELQRRKDAIVHRQLRDQIGEETRSFDPSNESW